MQPKRKGAETLKDSPVQREGSLSCWIIKAAVNTQVLLALALLVPGDFKLSTRKLKNWKSSY